MKTAINLIIALSLVYVNTHAQDDSGERNPENAKKAFQISFIYPLGTNGTNSFQYSNDISINVLGGYNGGVNAFELGAFANINKGNVSGFQLAGFTNVNTGKTSAMQIAGFYNQNKGFKGSQFAGFLNLNNGNSSGLMTAGFANLSKGMLKGWQLAGFINNSLNMTKGVQIAGFTNVAGNVNGLQLAGFINVAQKVKGVQLGFINVADSVDGLSFGFLSIVKNGYHKVEIGVNESLFASLGLKIGTTHFYNIFTGSFRQKESNLYWSYGYGIGSGFKLLSKVNLNLDAVCQQMNENHWETEKLNLLNTLRLNASFNLYKRLEIAAGPSFNVVVAEFDPAESIGSSTDYYPYCFYDQVHENFSIKMFIGFNAAIRF